MKYSTATRADLELARKEAAATIEHIDWVLDFMFPNSGPETDRNGFAEVDEPPFAEQIRCALEPALGGTEASLQVIRTVLLEKGVIDDEDRKTYNKVNTALSRAGWAKNVGRGVYLIKGGQPSPNVGAGDEQEHPPKKLAADWQKQLDVSNPLHAATMATGGWRLDDLITEAAYKEALKSYREGPA